MRFLAILILIYSTALYAQPSTKYDSFIDPSTTLQKRIASLSKNISDPELYCLLGQSKFEAGEYDSAIFYCNKSIQLLTKNKNNKHLIQALHIKGNAQYYLDDKVKAEENWRSALQTAILEKDTERANKLCTNIGALYLDEVYLNRNKTLNFKTADSFFAISFNAHNLDGTLSSEHGLLTLRLMATSLQFQHKYDSAHHYYEKVIELSKGKSASAYLGALTFYAQSLSEIGKHEQARKYMNEAVQFTLQNNSTSSKDKTHMLQVYGKVLYNSGNFSDAYQMNDSAYQLLAADYKKLNIQAYSESESKFKNQILQYQIEIEKQKKKQVYFLLAGLLVLTTLSIFWIRNKSNKRIAREKARQKQIAIDSFIEGEEKEKARIGRELHDGIAQEIIAVKLAMHHQHADSGLIADLNRISSDIRNISHELMPQTLKEYGLPIAIKDICQKILTPSGIQYEIHTTLSDERFVDKIEITIYRIFQELVHNIIKHSHATEVLVQLRKMNNHILLVVEDNGRGMSEGKKDGIGISNLISRVQLLDGNLQYESNDNEGTTAIVRVPL